MAQHQSSLAVRLISIGLFLTGGSLATDALSQTLPNLRTTMVADNRLQPSPCFEFACFNRSSYDADTLAAIGSQLPNVYVFQRIPAGSWYQHVVLINRTTLPAGYDTAGYRWPIAVVGNDIFVTAYQTGPAVPQRCATYVYARNSSNGFWQVKQVINTCASNFAKDGARILFGTGGPAPIYVRGADGLYTQQSVLTPPSGLSSAGPAALHNWTVVIGNPSANSGTGTAHIYQRVSGEWVLSETLVPEGGGTGTQFGTSVGVYDYNVAVSAPGATNPSGVGRGLVYLYTGVGENWSISQEIAEPPGTDSTFGTALALRGRRLVVSSRNGYPFFQGPSGYLFERGVRESAWVARATMAGFGLSIDLSGNTAMVDAEGLRSGTFPTIVNLPALREPDVAP
jgi:hypothetical protein